MNQSTPRGLFLALALTLAACSGADPKKEAFAAMQTGDYASAATNFTTALEGLGTDAEDYVEVAVSLCQALGHTDAEKAKAKFTALVASHRSKLTAKHFSAVISDLVSAGNFGPAIDLVDVGMKMFPEAPKMTLMKDKVVEASKKSGDPAHLAKLKGLGYL